MARRLLESSDIAERQEQRAEMRFCLDALTTGNTPLLNRLRGMQNTDCIQPEDVDLLWNTLMEVMPVGPGNEGIYQHLCDSAAIAARLSVHSDYRYMDVEEAAFMAIIRNSSMLMGQKEYFRKSMVSTALAKRVGVRADLKSALLPLPLYITPKDENDQPRLPSTNAPDDPVIADNARIIMKSLSKQQQIMEMAGLLAKRNPETKRLLTFDEVMEGHLKTRAGEEGYRKVVGGKTILWPSAHRALKDIEASGLAQSYAIVYTDWLQELAHSGYDHDATREEIDRAWDDPDWRLENTKKALLGFLRLEREVPPRYLKRISILNG